MRAVSNTAYAPVPLACGSEELASSHGGSMNSSLSVAEASEFWPAQRQMHESIKNARRTAGRNIGGLFQAPPHSEALADRSERLGAFSRCGSSLSPQEAELLVLCAGTHHQCLDESQLHGTFAGADELRKEVLRALRSRSQPRFDDERLSSLYALAMQLLASGRIEQDLSAHARRILGEQTLMEAIGILGYYAFVAMTRDAFETRLEQVS